MAQWVKRGGCLPKDGELKRELCAPTYIYQNGRFQIEDKKQIKSRLGFSPDKADALCLTFALPELKMGQRLAMSRENQAEQAQGRALTEYDPLQEIEKSSMFSGMSGDTIAEDTELPGMQVEVI
jgi:hypothetical protein